MDLHIKFEGNIDSEVSEDLKYLDTLITDDYGFSTRQEIQKNQSGEKDSGLMVGLTIAGVALTGIQTVITAAQFWQSQCKNTKYILSIYSVDKIYTLDNANKEEVNRILQIINQLPVDVREEIEIKVSRK
ncbi:hypothetical protein RIVM261_075860 [Rivularia sp. IAM M-261]|nr:hypothetical protein RIVM261_075860 [Rivularia sp. IAM M-261]